MKMGRILKQNLRVTDLKTAIMQVRNDEEFNIE